MLRQFLDSCDRTPDAVFVTDEVRGPRRTFTYSRVLGMAISFARSFEDRGVGRGDRILVTVRNSVEWVAIDLAAQLAGILPLALSPAAASHQKRSFVEILRPAAVITEESDSLSFGDAGAAVVPVRTLRAEAAGDTSLDLSHFSVGRDEEDILYLASTSGTTGGYKACKIRYRNALHACRTFAASIPLGKGDRNLIFLPLSQTRVNDLYFFLYCGGAVGFANPYRDLVSQVIRYRPTFIASPPAFFQDVATAHADLLGSRTLGDLLGGATKLYTGTTPVSPALLAYYRAHGLPLYEVYGMTECCSLATGNRPSSFKEGTVGRPQGGVTVKVADDGELLVRGESVFAGYWGDEPATRQALVDGWLHTGDVGEYDEDGFLVLVGRKKDSICLSTGKKLFPKELEAVLSAHPACHQVAFVGNTLDRAVAVACLRPDTAANRARFLAELHRRVSTLPFDERVTDVLFLEMPLSVERGEVTATGKPVRRRIESNHWDAIMEMVK